jgi:TonB family protein
MEPSVDGVLEGRRRLEKRGRWGGYVAASLLHAVGIAAIIVVPAIRAQRAAPIEYVAVQIVPAQALGIQAPAPPKPQPKPEPPKPEPTPEPPKEAMAPPEKPPEVKKTEPAATPPPAAPSPAAETRAREGSPTGSPMSGSSFGAAIAGLDNPDFTYGYYIDQMLSQIRANWVRPPLGGGIEAVVHFRVLRDGRIDDLRIVTSSGYSSFDLAGLRAVQSASPLPPLPASYRRGELGVNLVIR